MRRLSSLCLLGFVLFLLATTTEASAQSNNSLQVATTPDSIPQGTIIPVLGKDYTSIDSLKRDSSCIAPKSWVERRACRAKTFAEKLDSLIESRSLTFYPTTMQALPKGDMRMIYAGYYYLFLSPALVEVHLPAERGLSQYMTMLNFDTEQIADFTIAKYLAEWSISLLIKSNEEEYQISMTISTITGEARVLIENSRLAMLYTGSVGERREENKREIREQQDNGVELKSDQESATETNSSTATTQIIQQAAGSN